jgi:hypothetical protein
MWCSGVRFKRRAFASLVLCFRDTVLCRSSGLHGVVEIRRLTCSLQQEHMDDARAGQATGKM